MAQKQSFAVVMLLACFTQTLFAARVQNTQTRVQHTELASDSLETINPFVRAVRNLMAVRTVKLKQQQQQVVAGSAENQLHQAMGGPATIFCCCGWMTVCKDREFAPDVFVGLKIGSQEMCCVASHIYKCQGRNQLFPFVLDELLPAIAEAAPGLLVISNEGSETTQGHCPVQKSIEDEAKPTEIEAKPTEVEADPMWGPMGRCEVADSTKIDCGHSETQQPDCEASGCCWQPAGEGWRGLGMPAGTPWCYRDSDFEAKPTEIEAKPTEIEADPMQVPMGRCEVADSTKIDCGHSGTQQPDCEASGCCWQPAGEGSKTPWCYQGSDFN